MKKGQGFPPFPQGGAGPAGQQQREQSQFRELSATELYCPRCKRAMPVRERLLLVLPTGNLIDYSCKRCGESLGKKTG